MTPNSSFSRGPPSRPSSVIEDGDDHSVMTTSRPTSLSLMPRSSAASSPSSPPSLRDILTNAAPPPFSLGAFMAFLSQNHCLETLEFTMDVERYRSAYSDLLTEQSGGSAEAHEHVCSLWQKLMNAYILPHGPREVNLPAHVRDRLLSLPATDVPPNPSELDEAARIVYELMNDSVLGPFLASASASLDGMVSPDAQDPARQGRPRNWAPKDAPSSPEEFGRSPRSGFLPLLSIPWGNEPKSSASSCSDAADRAGGLTDDSANTPSPTGMEPLTPPTPPPTSDWCSSASPGGLQKAIAAHNHGWKKMGAKLGLSRIGRNKRGNSSSATSAGPDVQAPTSGPAQSRRKTNPL